MYFIFARKDTQDRKRLMGGAEHDARTQKAALGFLSNKKIVTPADCPFGVGVCEYESGFLRRRRCGAAAFLSDQKKEGKNDVGKNTVPR